jgi:hypothetical protein
VLGAQLHVAVHLASLTIQILPCLCHDIPGQAKTIIPGADDGACGIHSRMYRPVQMVKYLWAVRKRNQRLELASWHVPLQFQITYLFETNLQARGCEHLLYL